MIFERDFERGSGRLGVLKRIVFIENGFVESKLLNQLIKIRLNERVYRKKLSVKIRRIRPICVPMLFLQSFSQTFFAPIHNYVVI